MPGNLTVMRIQEETTPEQETVLNQTSHKNLQMYLKHCSKKKTKKQGAFAARSTVSAFKFSSATKHESDIHLRI